MGIQWINITHFMQKYFLPQYIVTTNGKFVTCREQRDFDLHLEQTALGAKRNLDKVPRFDCLT